MKKLFLLFAVVCTFTFVHAIAVQAQDMTDGSLIQVTDAKLGTGVAERMITGEAETFPKDSQVFVWMKISGGTSQEITVTWKSGDYSKSIPLTIGGSPWRTWAHKNVLLAGDWTVTVTTADGKVLKELSFKVE